MIEFCIGQNNYQCLNNLFNTFKSPTLGWKNILFVNKYLILAVLLFFSSKDALAYIYYGLEMEVIDDTTHEVYGVGTIVNARWNISCSNLGGCTVTLSNTISLSLQAIPERGYKFSHWEGKCLPDERGEDYCYINMATSTGYDHIKAHFYRPQVNGSCGSSHGETFATKPSWNLCEQGSPSGVYDGGLTWKWYCDGEYGGYDASCSAQKQLFTLTTSTSPDNAGEITCSPNPGTSDKITHCYATPKNGFKFDSWAGDCSSLDQICSFNNLVEDKNIIAIFSPVTGVSPPPETFLEVNQSEAKFGSSVSKAGDVDNDGFDDVIVGAPFYDGTVSKGGAAFLFRGSNTGLAEKPTWTATSEQSDSQYGMSVSNAGDINGDGYDDVIVGAPEYSNGQINEGAVFLYLGSSSGLSNTASWKAESNQDYARYGTKISSVGDVNNDGYDDVIVGAPYFSNGENNEGAIYLYLGSETGFPIFPSQIIQSQHESYRLGLSISGAGDVNGDGYDDVIAGISSYGNFEPYEGAATLYYGTSSGLSPSPNWLVESNIKHAQFGSSVSGAGDVNGDGFDDVLITAPFVDLDGDDVSEGALYIYLGSSSGLSYLPLVTISPSIAGVRFSKAVSAGDVNEDGFADIIVGASGANGETNEGIAFLYLGSDQGVFTLPNWQVEPNKAGAFLGYSLASAGDINQDGHDDVIFGALGYENGLVNEGATLVYHGHGYGLGVFDVCGSSHGQSFTTMPSENLCALGSTSPSSVNGGGPWYWVCEGGVNSGIYAKCSAQKHSSSITTIASPIDAGTVSCYPNPVFSTETTHCYANPNTGYTFDSWSVDCDTTTGNHCYLTNIIEDINITAYFTVIPTYTVSTTTLPEAGGTITCTQNIVNQGSDVTCTASSSEGYSFASWSGDCSGINNSTCTFSNVNTDKNITANFELTPVNGNCGSANGSTRTSAPTEDLCSSGIPTDITGTGTWFWSCSGINGGADSLGCFAIIKTYTVTSLVSDSGGGRLDVMTELIIDHGRTRSYQLTPDVNYMIESVGGSCGGTLEGVIFTTNPIISDCTVIANFLLDTDGDLISDYTISGNPLDNCLNTPNADQIDTDNDDQGNACDVDDDNDGVVDEMDAYPLVSLEGRTDTDGDGIPDECDETCLLTGLIADLDDDNDLLLDDIDPLPKVAANDLKFDIFGINDGDRTNASVAMSSDASTFAFGAPSAESNKGYVSVFTQLDSGKLVQLGSSIYGDLPGDAAGFALALNADGTVLVIGAYGADGDDWSLENAGSVKVYKWNGLEWMQLGSTIFGEYYWDWNGIRVSINSNGSIIAMSANQRYASGGNGYARVYRWDNNTWNKMGATIENSEAISLDSSGETIAIGFSGDDTNGTNSGKTRIFKFQNNSWVQKGTDLLGEYSEQFDGVAVSLSGDGHTLAIASAKNENLEWVDSINVYKWYNDSWNQVGLDITGAPSNGGTNIDVALSQDGNTLVIGTPTFLKDGLVTGKVRVFFWDGDKWSLRSEFEGDGIGSSVSINSSGLGLIVAPGSGNGVASMYLYDSDNDYSPDLKDSFVLDPAASIDVDKDGYPDEWNNGKTDSDSLSGLILDLFPTDPDEWSDQDLDSIGDNSDNCRSISNTDQSNIDGDTYGDACDYDIDGDGLDNLEETEAGTSLIEQDTDGDEMPDNWEVFYLGTVDPVIADAINDPDDDGYSNLEEYQGGSAPNDANDIPRRSKAWRAVIPFILNQ